MKRVIGLIVVSFLLGIAAEIAIAWGAVLSTKPGDVAAMETDGAAAPDAATIAWWRETADLAAVTDALMMAERRGEMITVRLVGGSDASVYTVNPAGATISLHHDPGVRAPWVRVLQVEAGWPRRAFRGERWESGIVRIDLAPFSLQTIPAPVVADDDVRLAGAVVLQLTGGTARDVVLPVRPIWDALLIDAAILALPMLAVLGLLTAVRRSVRRGRGRCPACGYVLRGGPAAGCPECGWRRRG